MRRLSEAFGTGFAVLFFVIAGLAGLYVFVVDMFWAFQWWGPAALFIGVITGPIFVAVMPFLILFKVGFIWPYFSVIGLGILGAIIGAAVKRAGGKSDCGEDI